MRGEELESGYGEVSLLLTSNEVTALTTVPRWRARADVDRSQDFPTDRPSRITGLFREDSDTEFCRSKRWPRGGFLFLSLFRIFVLPRVPKHSGDFWKNDVRVPRAEACGGYNIPCPMAYGVAVHPISELSC